MMKEIIIQFLYWLTILIGIVQMYVDYKANKFMIDMLIKKYKYTAAILFCMIVRELIIISF